MKIEEILGFFIIFKKQGTLKIKRCKVVKI